MQQVSMKQFLECGVHFGHQSRRWNPKMKKYIYTERNGIYIVDLKKTLKLLREATAFVRDVVADGGMVLFVGTKKQAKDAIEKWATQSNMYFVHNRWLGGMLTNFATVRRSVLRLLELEQMDADGTLDLYSKKERARLMRKHNSLNKNLAGVKRMAELPACIFVIDPHKEHIAVAEANKMRIPVVSLVDTNCDPDPIDYVIPGNDDAIRSVNLMCQKIAEACQEGLLARMESGLDIPEGSEALLQEQGLTSADREERYAEYRGDPSDEVADYVPPAAAPATETPVPAVDPSVLEALSATGEPARFKADIGAPVAPVVSPAAPVVSPAAPVAPPAASVAPPDPPAAAPPAAPVAPPLAPEAPAPPKAAPSAQPSEGGA